MKCLPFMCAAFELPTLDDSRTHSTTFTPSHRIVITLLVVGGEIKAKNEMKLLKKTKANEKLYPLDFKMPSLFAIASFAWFSHFQCSYNINSRNQQKRIIPTLRCWGSWVWKFQRFSQSKTSVTISSASMKRWWSCTRNLPHFLIPGNWKIARLSASVLCSVCVRLASFRNRKQQIPSKDQKYFVNNFPFFIYL